MLFYGETSRESSQSTAFLPTSFCWHRLSVRYSSGPVLFLQYGLFLWWEKETSAEFLLDVSGCVLSDALSTRRQTCSWRCTIWRQTDGRVCSIHEV
ncbi:hypothetical protein AVEN_71093-1 [Araneus ventricosus]|uniref:Uncharacterized protein n=1 Tax=Araneus ventricosus TaxID=182803 RepID=A0A4Y2TVL7_ARAVE|nr:hypothetical protein AVEN_71093-1 [Araneus ventricosus]